MIKDRQAQLALERELAEFEAKLEKELAFQEWYANFLENKAAEEALEKELAAFEAQLEAELAAEDMMAEIEEELARQAALEAFQQKLADEPKLRPLHLLQHTNPSLLTMLWLKNLWKL